MTRRSDKRRKHNEGSIYQRKDGYWVAAVTIPATGKRRSFYGKTRPEVEAKMAEVLGDLSFGIMPPERQTLADFLNYWLANVIKPSTRARTYRWYEQQVRLHIIPALGRVEVAKLTPQQVDTFFGEQRRAGRSEAGIDATRRTLRAALNSAVKKQLIPRNVVALTNAPKVERREIQPLDRDDVLKVLAALRGNPNEALFLTAIATGLRLGELLGLRWDDVDLEAGVLMTRQQLQRVEGEWRLVPLKTKRSRRSLALPPLVVNVLSTHREQQARRRQTYWGTGDDLDLVFTTQYGNPHDGRNVYHYLQKALKRAELPPIRFHDLRHTAATLLLAEGVDLRTLMDVLGHSQISMTADTYAHVLPAGRRDAASKMQGVLSGWED